VSRTRRDRPHAITSTDQMLGLLADQLDDLLDVLHERLPAPTTPDTAEPTGPVSVDITEPARPTQPRRAPQRAKRAATPDKRAGQ
jgi:hypothetical protein